MRNKMQHSHHNMPEGRPVESATSNSTHGQAGHDSVVIICLHCSCCENKRSTAPRECCLHATHKQPQLLRQAHEPTLEKEQHSRVIAAMKLSEENVACTFAIIGG